MKRVPSTLAFVIATALGCGGGQRPASEPNETSRNVDSTGAERTEPGASEAEASKSETGASSDAETTPETGSEKSNAGEAPAKCRESSAKLALAVERQSVDLDRGVLQATMDGPICAIKLTLTRKDGQKVEASFAYTSAQRELKWSPVPRDQIETIEVRVAGPNNAYQAVTLVPWSVAIDHKEVEFDTDKADIRASEVPALEDSLAKIKQVLQKAQDKHLGMITLFVAGRTDTRGSAERNLDLSRRRAQSIAGWFKKRGLCIPIAYDGFGETVLRKMTADEVDEPANRGADYLLAVEPPTVAKGASPAWKWISKGC